jgi:hypothetical protein
MAGVFKLLLQGFGASMSGIPLDLWLAGLSEEDREALTAFSNKITGQAPILLGDGAQEEAEGHE